MKIFFNENNGNLRVINKGARYIFYGVTLRESKRLDLLVAKNCLGKVWQILKHKHYVRTDQKGTYEREGEYEIKAVAEKR